MLGERYEILFYQKLVGAPSVLNTYLLYTMGLFEKGERIVSIVLNLRQCTWTNLLSVNKV